VSKNSTDSVKFDYEHELRKLQIELLKFQNHVGGEGWLDKASNRARKSAGMPYRGA